MTASETLRADFAVHALTVWHALRPPFLLGSVVYVLLGVAVARRASASLAGLDVALVFRVGANSFAR